MNDYLVWCEGDYDSVETVAAPWSGSAARDYACGACGSGGVDVLCVQDADGNIVTYEHAHDDLGGCEVEEVWVACDGPLPTEIVRAWWVPGLDGSADASARVQWLGSGWGWITRDSHGTARSYRQARRDATRAVLAENGGA